jgi:hypothetical protein
MVSPKGRLLDEVRLAIGSGAESLAQFVFLILIQACGDSLELKPLPILCSRN